VVVIVIVIVIVIMVVIMIMVMGFRGWCTVGHRRATAAVSRREHTNQSTGEPRARAEIVHDNHSPHGNKELRNSGPKESSVLVG
jgi:hypothetical protein